MSPPLANLGGCKVAVDVQHLYRTGLHRGDQGSTYTLPGGLHVTEAHTTTIYALALCDWLRARGAEVLTNDPRAGRLVGPYPSRNREAESWGAQAYLACHLNAGGGRYAMCESMAGSTGTRLGAFILSAIAGGVPEIVGIRQPVLLPGERGSVCIRAVRGPCAAVILEPFFGDHPRSAPLFATPRLVQLAGLIGEGVASWYASRLA